MVMWWKREKDSTFFDWLDRCLGSGRYPGPLWARAIRGVFSFAKRINYRINERRCRHVIIAGLPLEERDLVYAAFARCKCGAGLAYHKAAGMWGSWHCATDLLRDPWTENHKHTAFPFSYYEIKSEAQPSANGATTRPGVKRVVHGLLGPKFIR